MHSIDRKWSNLAAGYQAIQSYKTKLAAEFGRAVQVGHKHKFHKDLTEWQKKRRVFFALVAVAPLSIIALCLTAFYFREVACVIVYWAALVLIILVTLAVAGRQYIGEMVNGKPVQLPAEGLVVDLEGRWWDSLAPQALVPGKPGEKEEVDFLALFAQSIPDTYSARILADTDVLLLGSSGIWFLKAVDWSGMVVKQEGAWKQVHTLRDKLGRKRSEEKTVGTGPDDRWLKQKQEIYKTLEEHSGGRAWTLDQIHGGVVFSHPKANLDKKRIQGNTASYGPPKAWVERIRRAPAVDGFSTETQLEILDVLSGPKRQQSLSAKEEAERLYREAAGELHEYVAEIVK